MTSNRPVTVSRNGDGSEPLDDTALLVGPAVAILSADVGIELLAELGLEDLDPVRPAVLVIEAPALYVAVPVRSGTSPTRPALHVAWVPDRRPLLAAELETPLAPAEQKEAGTVDEHPLLDELTVRPAFIPGHPLPGPPPESVPCSIFPFFSWCQSA